VQDDGVTVEQLQHQAHPQEFLMDSALLVIIAYKEVLLQDLVRQAHSIRMLGQHHQALVPHALKGFIVKDSEKVQ
jgi:hypothetical protein